MTAHPERRRARWTMVIGTLLLLCAGLLLWRLTALADWATPHRLSAWISQFRSQPWAPLAIVGIFVLGGLIAVPLTILLAATALVLNPLPAFLVSMAGALASAQVAYLIGAYFIRNTAQVAFGPTLAKVRAALSGRGVIAIATLRMVPIAPFIVVNVALGSIRLPMLDYLFGTALGLAPGMIAFIAFGGQLRTVLEQPTAPRIAALAAIVIGWIVLSLLLQRFISRRQRNAN